MRPDIIVNGLMFGLRVIRERWFETVGWSVPVLLPRPPRKPKQKKTGAHRGYSSFRNGAYFISVAGNNFNLGDAKTAMGIDWMTSRREIAEAIPPAYTMFVGGILAMTILREEEMIQYDDRRITI